MRPPRLRPLPSMCTYSNDWVLGCVLMEQLQCLCFFASDAVVIVHCRVVFLNELLVIIEAVHYQPFYEDTKFDKVPFFAEASLYADFARHDGFFNDRISRCVMCIKSS